MPQAKNDPDQGLEIREEVKERLKQSLAALERGDEGIPIEQVEMTHKEDIECRRLESG